MEGEVAVKNHHVVVTQHGGPEVLQMVEEDLPKPKPGHVRVKVQAAGISNYDLMHRRSRMLPGTPRIPFTLGLDVVGVVDELGEGVSELQLGQQVAGWTFANDGGGYSEFTCLPTSDLVPVPEGVDPAEAVCLVVNYITAYVAMHMAGKVKSGERILVQGAAGGVGTALLDLGRMAELEMYGTASAYNHEVLSAFGATAIDYRTEDFVERIQELTSGEGVDVVFDPIGGSSQIWRSQKTLRKNGRLVWFGVAGISKRGMGSMVLTMLTNAFVGLLPNGKQAPSTPDLRHDNVGYRETLSKLLDALKAGKLKPLVAERIPLGEAVRAHELLEKGGYAGKFVLVPQAAPSTSGDGESA